MRLADQGVGMVSISVTPFGQAVMSSQSDRPSRAGRAGRRGFSLIEIMVVIAIILILMSIGVIGYRYLDKSASSSATKVALNNCDSMMAEYEAAGNSVLSLPNATTGPRGGYG